jgi:N utilization substance protein A
MYAWWADLANSEFRVMRKSAWCRRRSTPTPKCRGARHASTNPGINLGEAVEQEVTPSALDASRANAKQVLLQKLREAERVQVVSEYADKSGEMFRGQVYRMERGNIIVQNGKAEAILPRREQIQGENYRIGDSIYVFVVEVRQEHARPQHHDFAHASGLVRQLFMLEVPEIADGIVELKA